MPSQLSFCSILSSNALNLQARSHSTARPGSFTFSSTRWLMMRPPQPREQPLFVFLEKRCPDSHQSFETSTLNSWGARSGLQVHEPLV